MTQSGGRSSGWEAQAARKRSRDVMESEMAAKSRGRRNEMTLLGTICTALLAILCVTQFAQPTSTGPVPAPCHDEMVGRTMRPSFPASAIHPPKCGRYDRSFPQLK